MLKIDNVENDKMEQPICFLHYKNDVRINHLT